MPISTFSSFKSKLDNAQLIMHQKTQTATNFMGSSWLSAPNAGVASTTSVALDNTTQGGIAKGELLTSAYNRWIGLVSAEMPTNGASVLICDRLVHSGGLSGIVTTEQTTNLPTASLTRYTSGVGVFIALEVYGAIGATATTATVRYTNQAGTANRVTKAIVFGGSGNNAVGAFRLCPLQDGDTGVLSVEGVTLLASTATAGNFGVVLFKPIQMVANIGSPVTQQSASKQIFLNGGGTLGEITGSPCLFTISSTSVAQTAFMTMKVINDQ